MLRQSCIGSDRSSVTRYPFACDLDHTQEKEEVKCLWERLLRSNYQGAFFAISVVFLGFRRLLVAAERPCPSRPTRTGAMGSSLRSLESADSPTVQRMLRQSHVEMTMHYVHNSRQAQNAQAEFIERFLPNGNWEQVPASETSTERNCGSKYGCSELLAFGAQCVSAVN